MRIKCLQQIIFYPWKKYDKLSFFNFIQRNTTKPYIKNNHTK